MKILLLYGTTEGQTRKIADFIATKLKSYGDVVTQVDATTASSSSIDLRDYHGAIVAASIHAGQYQNAVIQFTRANSTWLNQIPSAFISVSLSAAGSDAEELKSIATIAENFRAYTGWTSADIHQVAGAFRFTEYDFFKRWVMKLIAWEKSVKIEPGRDLELTNWDALATTIDTLRARFRDAKTRKAS